MGGNLRSPRSRNQYEGKKDSTYIILPYYPYVNGARDALLINYIFKLSIIIIRQRLTEYKKKNGKTGAHNCPRISRVYLIFVQTQIHKFLFNHWRMFGVFFQVSKKLSFVSQFIMQNERWLMFMFKKKNEYHRGKYN